MANTSKPTPSNKIVKDSETMWHNFLKATKICGIFIIVVLVLMGLTLV